MLFFRIILLLFFNVMLNSISYSQNINVEIEELLVLGNDENASAEYLFSLPEHICTDKKNNIYISDKNVCKIKVYDQNGKYIKSIGQKGQGPGEMQDITCFTVDKKDIGVRSQHKTFSVCLLPFLTTSLRRYLLLSE